MAGLEYYVKVKAAKYFGPLGLELCEFFCCHEAFEVAVVRVHYCMKAVGITLEIVAPFFECGNDGQ